MIKLTDRLVMTADKHCYVGGEPRQRVGRPIEIKDPKYYAHAAQVVKGALDAAMRMAVEDGEVTTLREFIRKQKQLQFEFETMIAPLRGGEARQNMGEGRKATGAGKNVSRPIRAAPAR